MASAPKVFLTGRPGIGKTTVIRRFLALTRARCGGFYTEEIRRGGQRFGFSLNLLSGEYQPTAGSIPPSSVLASVEVGGRFRVGKYGVDVPTFEATAVPAIEKAVAENCLAVVDEIGKMELFSEAFRRAVRQAIESPVPVLGTILSHPHPFADEIRQRGDVRIVEVTWENRDALPAELAGLFGFSATA